MKVSPLKTGIVEVNQEATASELGRSVAIGTRPEYRPERAIAESGTAMSEQPYGKAETPKNSREQRVREEVVAKELDSSYWRRLASDVQCFEGVLRRARALASRSIAFSRSWTLSNALTWSASGSAAPNASELP